MPFHSTTIFTLAYLLPLSLAHLPQQKNNLLSSITKALLAHTIASFWRKQSCFFYDYPGSDIRHQHLNTVSLSEHWNQKWGLCFNTFDPRNDFSGVLFSRVDTPLILKLVSSFWMWSLFEFVFHCNNRSMAQCRSMTLKTTLSDSVFTIPFTMSFWLSFCLTIKYLNSPSVFENKPLTFHYPRKNRQCRSRILSAWAKQGWSGLAPS